MAVDDQHRPALARGVRLQVDGSTGEPVLLHPEGVVHLSATANDILTRCNGQDTVGNIVSALADEYDADRETLRRDVEDCLMELQRRKLVNL